MVGTWWYGTSGIAPIQADQQIIDQYGDIWYGTKTNTVWYEPPYGGTIP